MTIITCTNFTIDTMYLFQSLRRFHNDKIVWLLADTKNININTKEAIENYYGNMEIISFIVNEDYWKNKECLHRAQWEDLYNYTRHLPPEDIIIRIDGTDVVIQKPLNIPDIKNNEILVNIENIQYKDSGTPQHSWWTKPYQDKYANDYIINSGFIASKAGTFNRIAKEMAYGHYPEIFCDQNILHIIAEKQRIIITDQIDMVSAMIRRKIDKREDGLYYFDGIAPSVVHCCGSKYHKEPNIVLNDMRAACNINGIITIIKQTGAQI